MSRPTEVVLPANNWRPRHYQQGFWKYMQETPWGARAVLCHHRRAGKDHCAINWAAPASQLRVGLYIHVLPYQNQARRVIWNGIDRNGRKFLSAFPPELIEAKNDMEMRLTLKNGSIYQVLGGDDPDKLVGINCVGAIFSEYALMDPNVYQLVRPILAENGGWAIFPSTPRGRNHFHKLIYGDGSKDSGAIHDKKWYVSMETVDTTRAVDPKEIDQMRKEGMEEALIQQEMYCSFDAPMAGAYYEKQMIAMEEEGRVAGLGVDPSLEVHTAWDLGINDHTAIWIFQIAKSGAVHIIDYVEQNSQGLSWYINDLDKRARKGDWMFGTHFGPHDLAVRELGTGKTRLETARELGIRFTVVPKHDVADGIDCCRQTLSRVFLDKKLTRCVDVLKNYRKEWDEKLKVYRDKPRHDEYSHGADAFRYLCMGIQHHLRKTRTATTPRNVQSEYDPFA